MEIYNRRWAGDAGEETTSITCKFLDSGRLRLEGYDSGPSVERAWGDFDYEYSMEFCPEEFRRLIPHLLKHVFNSSERLTFGQILDLANRL